MPHFPGQYLLSWPEILVGGKLVTLARLEHHCFAETFYILHISFEEDFR